MFEGIGATGWLVIIGALVLGFGIVRFLIATMADRSSGLPPLRPDGDKRPWHEVLGVAPDAPIEEVQRAYVARRAQAQGQQREIDRAYEQSQQR